MTISDFRSYLAKLPPWCLSILCLIAILWLTLAPKPLGDIDPPLFEGADKVVHAIMFGGLTAMLILDRVRRNHWQPVTSLFAWRAAAASALLGALIEVAQHLMGLGRGFDRLDIYADLLGACLTAQAILWWQKYNRRRHRSKH